MYLLILVINFLVSILSAFPFQSKYSTSSDIYIASAIGTWDFSKIALEKCKKLLHEGESSIDAVEQGINAVELDTEAQYYVGVGGLPNAQGFMEFDAAIMDSNSRYGAVMALQNIATPLSVARHVMENCVHNILVGDGALQWAKKHGFKESQVLTESSKHQWIEWKRGRDIEKEPPHDTVGLICLDKCGRLCAGTSTSGWKFKHPGRVGDSPLVGSGLYCDGSIGAAVATGDGEEIMRSCLCFLAVEHMRLGKSAQEACKIAIERVSNLMNSSAQMGQHAKLTIGIIAMDKFGNVGAASTLNMDNLHRGNAYFPAMLWRDNFDDEHPFKVLKASSDGIYDRNIFMKE